MPEAIRVPQDSTTLSGLPVNACMDGVAERIRLRPVGEAGAGCTPEAVLKQLHRILISPDFDASERNRRFLRYVVEEVLAGRAERIKAYSIATTVFGRDASFDPQTDAIVRIEARRLRRSLERYYLTAGKSDFTRITIPKGSYSAKFEAAGSAPADCGTVLDRNRHRPAIFVAYFEEDGEVPAHSSLSRGFTRQLVVSLTRFTDLFVFGPETTLYKDMSAELRSLRERFGIDYVLRGGTTVSGDRFRVEALLIDARTGRNVWAESVERTFDPAGIITIRDDVANGLARTLALPYGVIYSNSAQELERRARNSLSSYESVALFYQYCRCYSRELHECVRSCLEKAIIDDPGYAEAFACLSLVYSDAYKFGVDVEAVGIDPRQRALALALRSIELAPHSSRAHQALSLVCWLSHDCSGSIEELETSRALNPNDAAVLADLGLHHALLAEWEQAVPLLEEAYACNPLQPGTYRVGLALFHYVQGRYDHALAEARKIRAPHLMLGHALEAMAAGQLGRHNEAKAAVQRILAIDPAYRDHIVADLRRHNMSLDLIQTVVRGLRKAGLSEPMDESEHELRHI